MKNKLLILILLLATFVLASCERQATALDKTQPTNGNAAGSCPTAAADTELLKNEAYGYCLLYPSGYDVERNDRSTAIAVGSVMQ